MAVQEKKRTQAPAPPTRAASRAAPAITPARTPIRTTAIANESASPVQRARASLAMQQNVGNARAEQMIRSTTTVAVQTPTVLPAPPTGKPSTVQPKVIRSLEITATQQAREPGTDKPVSAPTTKVPGDTKAPVAAPPLDTETTEVASPVEPTSAKEEPAAAETGEREPKAAAEKEEAKPKSAGEKKQTGEGEAAPEEAGAGATGAQVTLLMPEPPTEISPKTKRRIGGVKKRAGATAKAKADLPEGGTQVAGAKQAVTQPDEEANAKAAAALINRVPSAPSPQIVELCERIRTVIRKKRPPDEDALMKAEPEGEAMSAGNELNSTVASETKKVEDNYGTINQTPQAPAAKGGDLDPQPPAADTAPVNAKAATPDPVQPENVSLDADVADNKQKIEAAGMEKPTAKLAQTGPAAEARGAQGELEQTAKEDPAKVLANQQATLAKAEGDMAALQAEALAALTSTRGKTSKDVTKRQTDMVGSEETQRRNASNEAQKIFNATRDLVVPMLQKVGPNAMAEWEAAKVILVGQFKADLLPVQKRIDDRHSGVGGFFVGLWDAVTGLPGWAERAYTTAETNFGNGVIAKLTEISVKVNSVIAACEELITSARTRIDKIYADLPPALNAWAETERQKFDKQLTKLQDTATSTRDNFNKDLTTRAAETVDEVRAEIAELRAKAGGIIGRIANAIRKFVDDPIKFIIEALLDLLGIPAATFWAVVRKIKKAIADIADDPEKFANNFFAGLGQGFSQFFDNFGTHMINGFIDWLTGGLAGAGVKLPKDSSLPSIMTFFLQLMGITWPRIRKVLAKHLGDKNVALIEKVYSLLSMVIEKGPEGIFEMIKEKLNPQTIVDQIISLAVDFMVTAIIKAATARIIMLFNPVGAILQAIEAIYRVLKWIFQNAARIFSLIETIVNGIADILAGSIGGFANAVEKALAKLIAPVIAFIADYLGFGDLPSKIAEKVMDFQDWIMGLIEQALVFLIEKGKALLAAVGLGGKPEEKKGAGEGLDIGDPIGFEAGGESHSLWIDVSGENATLMVASTQQTVIQYLSYVERHGPPELSVRATEARALAEATDQDADDAAKLAIHVPEKDESDSKAEMTERQGKIKGKEKELVELLKEIFEGMNPIKPRLGKPVDDIKKSPYGYELWTDASDYEYGGSYSNTEIQRGSGFGSADEKTFPMVHVDREALVQQDAGLLRSDWPVIDAYESEIRALEAQLKKDEAPELKGGPYGPSNQLRAGARKQRQFTRGIRKQMETIVRAIREGEEITGIEVAVGKRRIDYTTRTDLDGKEINTLVEYKHWTGKLSATRRAELADKLEAQLKGQISGAKGAYSILRISWPAFDDLDAKSQQRFNEVIADVTDYGSERGVTVLPPT